MGDMAEDRIYADRLGKTDVFVATGLGVAVVSVSNDRIGQYSLRQRCNARDVAADDERVLAATDEDVLVADAEGEFEPTGFGPAVAVAAGPRPLAAAPDGTVAALEDGEWTTLGTAGSVRAIDGDLLATADGVYRVTAGGDGTSGRLDHVGLDDVRDVSAAGAPLAATADGCYRLGPGWTKDLEGSFETVAGDGARGGRSHAASESPVALYERPGDGAAWRECDLPTAEPVVDVGYVDDGTGPAAGGDGERGSDSESTDGPTGGVVAVTETGRFLIDPAAAKDGAVGWRSRSLGLPETAALAVPGRKRH